MDTLLLPLPLEKQNLSSNSHHNLLSPYLIPTAMNIYKNNE